MALLGLAIQLGVTGALWAVNKYLLDDGPGSYRKPRPEGLEFTQATIGDPIPLVYGTVRVDSAVLVWYGNEDSVGPVAGVYDYYASLFFVVGVPPYDKYDDPVTPASEVAPFTTWRTTWPPELLRVWWGDIEITLAGATHGATLAATGKTLENEGTLQFKPQFWDGRRNQVITAYPAAASNDTDNAFDAAGGALVGGRAHVPGYRHQMCVLLDSRSTIGGLGTNPRIPQIGFEVQALGPEPIDNVDANPVWVIWDLLLAPVWKIGYEQDRIDLTSFRAAATTLVNESHGTSLAIYQRDTAARIILGILEQIDGILFEDPSTGKLKLKLIRQDYVVAALPVLNADNTIGKPQITVHGWRDRINALHVAYTSRADDYERERASAWRLATNGGVIARVNARDVEFTGVTTAALAQTIAEREIAQVSRPFVSVTAKVNREFFSLLPGDAVLGYWPPLGIVDKVFRVLDVDLGQLDDGAITVTLVEDVHDATQEAVPPWGGVLDPEF